MGRKFYNLTHFSESDLLKIQRFIYYKCNFKMLSLKLALIILMFLICADYLKDSDEIKIILLFSVILFYEVIFSPFLTPTKEKERTIELTAYDNYMILSNLEDNMLIYYSEIDMIQENKNLYFLVFGKKAVAIDKAKFSLGNENDFKTFILEKIKLCKENLYE